MSANSKGMWGGVSSSEICPLKIQDSNIDVLPYALIIICMLIVLLTFVLTGCVLMLSVNDLSPVIVRSGRVSLYSGVVCIN